MAEATEKKTEAPVVRASSKYVRMAPRKARLVANQVRGLSVPEARTLLRFSTRGAAIDIDKLVASAAANAEANHDLIGDDLQIAEITVDEGPTLKRWRARHAAAQPGSTRERATSRWPSHRPRRP